MIRSLHIATPLGRMTLTASEQAIVGLSFGSEIPAGAELVAGGAELRADGGVMYTGEAALRTDGNATCAAGAVCAAGKPGRATGEPGCAAGGMQVRTPGEGVTCAAGEPGHAAGSEIPPLLRRAAEELGEYLAGRRRDFTLPLDPSGSDFQRQVWQALRSIPYGQTRTYGQIAEQIGRRRAARAVGMANNRNPIAILIPCHRVIGSDGSMTGYAAGIAIKERLLALERRNTPRAEGELFPVRDDR